MMRWRSGRLTTVCGSKEDENIDYMAAGLNVVSVERREQAWTVTVDRRQPTFCPVSDAILI